MSGNIDGKKIYAKLFMEFFTLGLFTFGGGNAMIATLQDRLEKKGWLNNEEILDCIVVSQSLPGVIAVNMSVYVGYRLKGFFGALISVIGMILPSFVIIVLIAMFLDRFEENPYITGALVGIRAAATGLILNVALRMMKTALTNKKLSRRDLVFTVIMLALSFGVITFFNISVVWMIIFSIIAGMIYWNAFGNTVRREGGGKNSVS